MNAPLPMTWPEENILSRLICELGSNALLYAIIEHIPNGLLVVGRDLVVLFGNPAACRFLGYEYGQLRGMPVCELLGIDSEDYRIGDFRREMRLAHRQSGESRMVEVVGVPPGRNSAEHAVLLVDVEERHQLEMQLRRSNTFFQNLIASSVDGIIASDMKGKLILFNEGAQRLLGYSEREALETVHVTQLYPEGEAHKIIARMRSDECGGKGRLQRHELIAISKEGEHIPMSLSGGIIYDGDKEIASFGIFTDMRHLQKVEEDLQQTHQMLQEAEKMAGLGRLAAGIAHEINNPMSGIMLYSNLVKEKLGEENALSRDMELIVSEAERCKTIVQDLLEFSHQTSYEMFEVDLNEVLLRALAMLEIQALFLSIEIKLDLLENPPRIRGNGAKLHQVFMNIMVNAAQAMRGKGRLIMSSRLRSQGSMIEYSIRDTGPGIDQEDLPRVFEPFFTTKGYGEGTGLGLSVSYAIVKEHKGTIRAESEPGRGAVFHLRFPVLEENATREV